MTVDEARSEPVRAGRGGCSAVDVPKSGTLTAKTAENAVSGPESGTSTAPVETFARGTAAGVYHIRRLQDNRSASSVQGLTERLPVADQPPRAKQRLRKPCSMK